MKKLLVVGLLLCVFTLGTYAQEKEKKEKLQRSLIGQRFPDFNVQEWIGKKPKLKGKFVLVDFWCIMAYPVTHRTVPYQNSLAKKYKKNLQIVGLTHDDAYIVKLVVDPDIRYYQGIVDEEVIINTFQLMAWPTSYLIDPDGIVVWEGNVLLEGWKDKNVFNLTEEMLEQFFKDYQKKKESKKSNSIRS